MSDSYNPVTPTWTDAGSTRPTDSGTYSDTGSSGTSGTADTAKEQASHLKQASTDAGKQVAGTAKDEAKNVASEAKSQAKDLIGQTRSQLSDQAGEQQKRAASGLRSIGDELSSMAEKSENQGPATDLVRQAASRVGGVASWLDDRDPRSLLGDVSAFARRRPGTFIAIAAIAGILAGRLTRSIASEVKEEREASTGGTASPVTSSDYSGTTDPGFASNAYATGAAGATTDDFSTAGDYLGTGSSASDVDPLVEPQIDEPPLSVGNEPYRGDSYRQGNQP